MNTEDDGELAWNKGGGEGRGSRYLSSSRLLLLLLTSPSRLMHHRITTTTASTDRVHFRTSRRSKMDSFVVGKCSGCKMKIERIIYHLWTLKDWETRLDLCDAV